MPGDRSLWTGPHGSRLRDQALLHAPVGPSSLWIVASEIARVQVSLALTLRRGIACGLRVWTWEDLWRAIQDQHQEPCALLSPAGIHAALDLAIGRAREDGQLRFTDRMAQAFGFRRRLRNRIAAWTRAERDPRGGPPSVGPDPDDTLAEEWAIFGRYRGVLDELGAEDPEGFAVWASRALRDDADPKRFQLEFVTVLEPVALSRAMFRALHVIHTHAKQLLVTLPWTAEQPEAFSVVDGVRNRFLEWGFAESSFSVDPKRPSGLVEGERRIFAESSLAPTGNTAGIAVLGAPQGEGVGLLVARRVTDLIETGAGADDILILARRWDDQAGLVLEALRSWEIPASGSDEESLANAPAVSALRLALSVPAVEWEADRVVRLLRHGQVRPVWPEARDFLALSAAAAAIRDTRVFRGVSAIRSALARTAGNQTADTARDSRKGSQRAARAELALKIFDRLTALFESCDQPATWSEQSARVRSIQEALRLGDPSVANASDRIALERLNDAIDDQGAVRESLGLGDRVWSWNEFLGEIDALARDLTIPGGAPASGSVRVMTVDQAEGARADHIILINLTEGTFPAREAIENDPVAQDAEDVETAYRANAAYAREMLRFLRVIGSAEHSLTLAYPTTDEKGQDLLTAGFLDELERQFLPSAWSACSRVIRRLDPVLSEDLAGSPREERIRTVAAACAGDEEMSYRLRELARSPLHRASLAGTAAALRVAAHRTSRTKSFGPFDGRLHDTKAAQKIAASFGPGRPAFSPSQLESLALCPFQFFLHYVLRLEPIDERGELDEDRTERGSLIHRTLETLHVQIRDTTPTDEISFPDRIAQEIEACLATILDVARTELSDVDAGIRHIETLQLARFGRRYAAQFAKYAKSKGPPAECHRFEVGFGKSGSDHGCLVIGQEHEEIQIQGSIDRIDLLRANEQTSFRVIDYKTGHSPSSTEFASGLAIQLPLYAWAIEQLGLTAEPAVLADFGYWSLRKGGYKAVRMPKFGGSGEQDPWSAYRERLEAYLTALVSHMRAGDFPVAPRKEDCTRTCDYSSVCRIAQVRNAGKVWRDAPRMESD